MDFGHLRKILQQLNKAYLILYSACVPLYIFCATTVNASQIVRHYCPATAFTIDRHYTMQSCKYDQMKYFPNYCNC